MTIVKLVAAGFIAVMTNLLIGFAISPASRVSIGEPRPWIAGPEALVGAVVVGALVYSAFRDIWELSKRRTNV